MRKWWMLMGLMLAVAGCVGPAGDGGTAATSNETRPTCASGPVCAGGAGVVALGF